MSETEIPQKQFILPEGFRYSCVPGCGQCCRGWEIDVDEKTYETLSKVDWAAVSDRFKNRKIFVESKSGKKFFELVDKTCIFLDGDNGCAIHKKLGYGTKAHTCKRYPVNFLETPDGILVRLSFVCPSVLKNSGQPLSEQLDYIKEIFGTSERDYHSISGQVLLDEETSIPWEKYITLETALLGLLDSGGHYEDSLRAGAKFLRYAALNVKNGIEIAEILDNAGKKSFSEKGAETSTVKRRLYMAVFAAKELVGREKKGAPGRYLSILKIVLGKGNIIVNGVDTNLEKVNKIKFDITDEAVSSTIKRYIRHLISTKWHLIPVSKLGPQNTNLISGYSFILIIYALIKWYSAVFAAQRGAESAGADDVEKAVSFIERSYAGHISRDAFFSNDKGFAQISNILITQANFEDIII